MSQVLICDACGHAVRPRNNSVKCPKCPKGTLRAYVSAAAPKGVAERVFDSLTDKDEMIRVSKTII